MKKEVLVAIFLGSLVGALLVGGIWTANNALKNKPSSLISAEPTSSAGPAGVTAEQTDSAIPLVLVSPLDLSLVTTSTASVEGKTLPNTSLIIQTETDTYFIRTGPDGTFSKDVGLTSGSNDLTVTAVGDNGEKTQKTVTVVYSTLAI